MASALVERDCAATAAELLGWLLLAAASQSAATQSALLMGAVVCSSVHDTGSHEAGCTMHMASQQQRRGLPNPAAAAPLAESEGGADGES